VQPTGWKRNGAREDLTVDQKMQLILRYLWGEPAFTELRFRPGHYIFGRAEECHVRLTHPSVSRLHFLLCVTEQGASIRDLGSRNSTAINSERIHGEQAIRHGDRLYVGATSFRILLSSSDLDEKFEYVAVPDEGDEATLGSPLGDTAVR
jgi:pSer/pThr/pTyr-binding forkhead associated (FHA) protein